MKKRVGLISCLILIIILGNFVYKEIIAKSFRYKTPIESFEKSGSSKASLVDILDYDDIALIVYTNKDDISSTKITVNDSRGWTPMSVNFKNQIEKPIYNGSINIKEIKGKYILDIWMVIDSDNVTPQITDSLNSSILQNTCELKIGKKLVYGLLVSENNFPQNYKIFINNEEISLMED